MRILFIAPLPPPTTGHSLAAQTLLDWLRGSHEVVPVDFNKRSFVEGFSSIGRVPEVLRVFAKMLSGRLGADTVYLTISESCAGNMKDLVTYALCIGKLPRMFIHLHGGSIKRTLWDRYPLLRALNRPFLARLGGVVVTGPAHREVFEGIVEPSRIHIVPNFAPDESFLDDSEIKAKFASTRPLRVLYMSNMIDTKGYLELADGYLALPDASRFGIAVDFAGEFELDSQRRAFLDRIQGATGLRYHGVAEGERKKALFAGAHVFCLPTRYFEGQPISILEAYAAGCFVLTTGRPGILDIFRDGENGMQLAAGTAAAVSEALQSLTARAGSLLPTALRNARLARERYRARSHCEAVGRILTGSSEHA